MIIINLLGHAYENIYDLHIRILYMQLAEKNELVKTQASSSEQNAQLVARVEQLEQSLAIKENEVQ